MFALACVVVSVLLGSAHAATAERVGPRLGAEMAVTATDHLAGRSNNSPLLVADPTDGRFVALASRLDAPDFGCALHLSGDGGRSWAPAPRGPSLPPGAEKCYGPEIAFDRQGTLYYVFVGLAGQGNRPMGAFLVTSTDRARTFSPPRRVLGPLNFGVRMVLDPVRGANGRLHLAWLEAGDDLALGGFGPPPNPIKAAYSDDGGRTFSRPVQVSDPARDLVVAPALALAPDGTVHLAYYDLGRDTRDYYGLEGPVWDGQWSLVLATSGDRGRTFGPGAVVDDSIAPPERVMGIFTMPPASVVADGTTRVCASWTDRRNDDPDVMLRCSRDRGRRWSAAVRVNDDPRGNGKNQYLPRLAVAPGGRLDVVFLDRRRDPNNVRFDAYLASSADGGRTFTPNARLGRGSSSARIGQSYSHAASAGLVEFGSRLGLLARRDGAVVAWPDTRNSQPGTKSQDIVARVVDLPDDRRSPLPGPALGILTAVALGLVALGLRRRRRRIRPGRQASGDSPDGAPSDACARRSGHPRAPVGRLLAAMAAAGGLFLFIANQRAPVAAGALPPPPQIIDVAMREYGFDYDGPVRPGRVMFRVRNAGTQDHQFEIYPLPADLPPLDEQLRGTNRRGAQPLVRPAPLRAGQRQVIAIDVAPGQRYGLICFLFQPPDGEFHALLGMNSEFRAPPTGN